MPARSARSPEPRDAKLEELIAANPDDASAWCVYADWLQQHGNVRGELAALQLELEKRDKPSIRARADALLEAHADQLRGPVVGGYRIEGHTRLLTWRGGFWESIGFSGDGQLARRIVMHPSARLLQRLDAAIEDERFEVLVDAIAEVGSLPALRRLTLGDIPEGQSAHAGEPDRTCTTLGELASRLPRLEQLRLRCPTFGFGDFSELRELRIDTGSVRAASLAAVFDANLPKLERLEILLADFGDVESDVRVASFARLLSGNIFPKLRQASLFILMERGTLLADLTAAAQASPLGKRAELVVSEDYELEEDGDDA